MRISDLVLLAKKIGIGIVITIVPLGILVGPLWVTQHFAKKNGSPLNRSTEVVHAN